MRFDCDADAASPAAMHPRVQATGDEDRRQPSPVGLPNP